MTDQEESALYVYHTLLHMLCRIELEDDEHAQLLKQKLSNAGLNDHTLELLKRLITHIQTSGM